MFSRRRSLFDFSRGRLEKAPRRKQRRENQRGVRLGVEQLEDRRLLSSDSLNPPNFQFEVDPGVASFQFSDGNRWSNTATDGGGLGQGDATTLTWSLVPDGTQIGASSFDDNGGGAGPSDLISFLDGIRGNGGGGADLTVRPWFQVFVDAFDRLGAVAGLTYVYEAADDGADLNSAAGSLGVRGDVRIGGRFVDGQPAGGSTLAYNAGPNDSDMVIDTGNINFYTGTANNSLSFRNTLMHEAGHGIGISHVHPIDQTKLMEPTITANFDGPQFDDILAMQRGYGDVLEKNGGNDTTGSATPLGLLAPGTMQVFGADAGPDVVIDPTDIDFLSIDDDSDTDVFGFQLLTGASLKALLTPLGPTYQQGPQPDAGDPEVLTSFDASSQSDLTLEILNGAGVVVATANANGVGQAEMIPNFQAGAGGQFFARVTGANNAAQFYQLQLVVGDRFEPNDTIATATILGSEPAITLRDLSIHTATDEDFFQITANQTGKLVINSFFEHAVGDIDIQVQDSDGNVIGSSTSVTDDEQIIIPVVGQEMYFLRVFGVGNDVMNTYDLEIENFPTPVPTGVHLDPASDTGTSNHDNITSNTQPRFFIQTDVLNFVDTDGNLLADDGDINVLTAAQAAAGTTDGIAVEITLINTTDNTVVRGFADALPAIAPEVYSFTPAAPLTDGVYFVTARTVIFDSREIDADPGTAGVQRDTGRSNASHPLWFTIIGAGGGGVIANADLLNSSDSGMFNNDNVTAKWEPAFQGVAPANSIIRLFANGELVGQTITGSDTSDVGVGGVDGLGGANNDGLGLWEITSEPLVDNGYDITFEVEDGAGNVTSFDPQFNNANPDIDIVVDKTEPNTPLLYLQDDTGENLHDGITNVAAPNFFMTTTDPNVALAQLLFTDNLKFRIFDRHDNNAEVLIYDSAADVAADNITTPGDMFTSLTGLTRALNLADGTHNLKLEVEDRAGNISHDFLLEVIVDTEAPVAPTPNLLDSSDSGMFNDDNVTNKMQPAFDNTAEVNTKVTVFAQQVNPTTGVAFGNIQLIGQSIVGSDATDGVLGNDLGLWEVTVEPLVDGVWDITTRIEDWAGNLSEPSEALRIVIDTEAPNTPYLDLLDDSGRHDNDNITKVNTPQVSMTTTDPNIAFAQALFTDNLKFRIYDRFETSGQEVLIYDSAQDAAADANLTAADMFTALTQITRNLPVLLPANPAIVGAALADGVHNLKLEVEDRAGNISHDFLLEITVDTVTPPVSFGLPDAASQIDGLAPDSDTGVTTVPATFADRATSDTTPRIWGRAEADSVVRVYLDRDADGVIDLLTDTFLGQTVALPYDGNDAYPDGYWELDSVVDLNEIVGLPKDGLRSLLVTAEDVAGNPMPMMNEIVDGVDTLDIFIDTQGPQVQSVQVVDAPGYDLFDPKPSVNGPTPLINAIDITFQDLPNRVAPDFVYDALVNGIATAPGNYLLVGDHVGIIPIQTVAVTASSVADGAPASATVTLTFFEALPDDRFTLTVLDNLVDPVGNQLDGESNADEPQEDPTFPSGDGVPGGDFVARFTVDTRPEIGSFVAQNIDLDINGNFVWDPANGQIGNDATNVDLTFRMNVADPVTGQIIAGGYGVHDLVFAGKFAPLQQLIVGDDAVFIIDVSGSTSNPFGGDPVGDQNGDGSSNTILDAEIAAFKLLNQTLVDRGLGNTSLVSIVTFNSSASSLDMDPLAAGVQLTTTPLADANGNGIRDVDEVLMSLNSGGGTNFEVALAEAITTLDTAGYAPGDANVIFLSDGFGSGAFADEVTAIRDTRMMNLRAFGVGPGASLAQLLTIDPAAVSFSNTNELLNAFGGGGGGGAAGNPSGFDQLAVYGLSTNLEGIPLGQRWLVDTNSDGVINTGEGDIFTVQPLLGNFDVLGAIPIAGNFDGVAANGDEIGLYNAGQWALDTNRNFVIDAADTFLAGNMLGHPIVGDFDGNGDDDLAVFNNNTFKFDMNPAGFDGIEEAAQRIVWGFPGVLDRPVAADMDQDGIDDIGLWVPRDSAQSNRPIAEWYFLLSAGAVPAVGTTDAIDHPFEPVPFGNDLYAEFGDELALPIVGNFDPPVVADDTPGVPITPNSAETGDFDHDGDVDGGDFLSWQRGFGMGEEPSMGDGDGNFDGAVDHADMQLWSSSFGLGSFAPADFNNDGRVDNHDLTTWGGSFGYVTTPGTLGDANFDGRVNGADFLAWQRDYQPVTIDAAVAVSSATVVASSPVLAANQAASTSTDGVAAFMLPAAREAAFEELRETPVAYLEEAGDSTFSRIEASTARKMSQSTVADDDASAEDAEAWELALSSEDFLLDELL